MYTLVTVSLDSVVSALGSLDVPVAKSVLAQLRDQRSSLALAESLTGGMLADLIVTVPGASEVFLGSAVTYSTGAKQSVLKVDGSVLDRRGAVDPEVVYQMAVGARKLFASQWAMATTGVAGPTPQDGKDVGTVFCAVLGPETANVYAFELGRAFGDPRWVERSEKSNQRSLIRQVTAHLALMKLQESL